MKTLLVLIAGLGTMASGFGFSPGPEPKPELGMLEAIQKATDHVTKTTSLEHHYLDRVWVGWIRGEEGRKWIVSWSPAGDEGGKSVKGWIIVTVDMQGVVSESKNGVSWIDPRWVEATRKLHDAEKELEEIKRKQRPKGEKFAEEGAAGESGNARD